MNKKEIKYSLQDIIDACEKQSGPLCNILNAESIAFSIIVKEIVAIKEALEKGVSTVTGPKG